MIINNFPRSDCLNSDLKDRELKYWTSRGEETAGFFVATIDEEFAGMISYVKQDDHLEIFRLAVDSNHRKAGVARALVNKIQSVGEILNLTKIKAETSSTFDSAVVFYQKHHWTEVIFYAN